MIQWFNSFVYMWRKLKDSFEQINTLLAFIVALFAICKIQKKLKCVSTHKWIKVMWYQFIQLFNLVRLFATPRTATRQASLSITNSQSLPKLMSIESVMPSNHLILFRPILLLPSIFPSMTVFSMSQLFASGGQSIGVPGSTTVLPKNTQDWSPLGWTGWISLKPKGPSGVFPNSTVQKHQLFSAQLSSQSNSHIHTWPLEKP